VANAVQAIGESWLGAQRAAIAAFTIALLLTFLGVRLNTRLIRAHVSWWFHDIESEGGVHVHHVVIGVVLMVVAGLALIATAPAGLWLQLYAIVFGAGVALTLDEFALILRLQDVYWTKEGRLSVDAMIVAVCAGLLLLIGFRPVVGNAATGAVICLFKGKLWTGFCGVFIPFIALVGSIRIARPRSPWARKYYATRPKKMAKSRRREVRSNATWRAWKTAFLDLIAGKPHLPSVASAHADAERNDPGT
jgi:lysyl-tRNA synthetase class 2